MKLNSISTHIIVLATLEKMKYKLWLMSLKLSICLSCFSKAAINIERWLLTCNTLALFSSIFQLGYNRSVIKEIFVDVFCAVFVKYCHSRQQFVLTARWLLFIITSIVSFEKLIFVQNLSLTRAFVRNELIFKFFRIDIFLFMLFRSLNKMFF